MLERFEGLVDLGGIDTATLGEVRLAAATAGRTNFSDLAISRVISVLALSRDSVGSR